MLGIEAAEAFRTRLVPQKIKNTIWLWRRKAITLLLTQNLQPIIVSLIQINLNDIGLTPVFLLKGPSKIVTKIHIAALIRNFSHFIPADRNDSRETQTDPLKRLNMKIYTLAVSLVFGLSLSFASLVLPASAQTISGVPKRCYVPSGISSCLGVKGKVLYPFEANLGTLEAFPVSTINVTFFAAGSVVSQSFTGALLWDVISASEVVLDSTVKNDILHKIVVVTGSDGYEAVFGLGEIAPSFGGAQILIAYATAGQSLGSNGFAKLIIPGDKAGGRFVSNIVKIQIKSVDE